MSIDLAKRIRSTIESAKQDLDLARQQRTTSATLKQCCFVNAIQVTKAFVEAVDGGIRLPGESVASVVFSRPMSDIEALSWWPALAKELRKAFPNRIKGSSGMLDYPRYLKNDRGEQMGRDGKPMKLVATTRKGPDGKTYFGSKPRAEPATDRDNLDEATLLEIERRIAADWSDLFGLLIESVQSTEDEGERDSKAKSEKTRKTKTKKPTVKLGTHPSITLDGLAISLKLETAIWIKALIEHRDFLSMSTFNKRYSPELGGNVRHDRLDVPDEVAKHVEGPTNAGFRWI